MNTNPRWEAWLRRRLSRRRALKGSAATISACALGAAACSSTPSVPPTPIPRNRVTERPPAPPQLYTGVEGFGEWSRHARLANASFGEDPLVDEMEATIRELKAQNVSVVEVDTRLSDWLSDDDFDSTMAIAAQLNRLVHREGMQVVWYYPALEIVSIGGQYGPSLFKTHPDWVQVGVNGNPNVFYGGVVFWVDPGDESAWMSPNGPWREIYFERVKKLVRTGADGIWPDVPLYFDVAYSWPDISYWSRAAFRKDTGLSQPSREDWEDPIWRHWIAWRHRNLYQFLADLTATARSENPDFEVFVETVPCDFYDATSMGLDGAYLRMLEGVTQAWEVDTVSDSHSMKFASHDDWISLISMYRYCRAASGLSKPAWVFSKGWQETDARQVMAEVLAAGCNPYEVQVPGKTVGVSPPMRTQMYRWVDANTRQIFDATPRAEIALFHSSPSRDYVDPNDGTAKFCNASVPAEVTEWWSNKWTDSAYAKQWIGEYRGMLKILVHGHLPFAVLTSPTFRTEDLDGIKVLLLPDLEAISDQHADIIRQYVAGGGTIILTGPDPTGMTEYGDDRPDPALADVLGLTSEAPPAQNARAINQAGRPFYRHRQPRTTDEEGLPLTGYANPRGGAPSVVSGMDGPGPPFYQLPANVSAISNSYGAGRAHYFPALLGLAYLNTTDPAAMDQLLSPILAVVTPSVSTDAGQSVHLEVKELDGDTVLHFTNFTGVTGDLSVVPTTFTVSVAIPTGQQVRSVEVTSPDNPTPEREAINYSAADGNVSFSLTVAQYSVVIIAWG